MKTIIKRFLVYLSVALMFLAASTAYAMPGFDGSQRGEKGPGFEGDEAKNGKGPEKHFQDMTEQLDLSKEQKEQLKTHYDQQKVRMKETGEALKTSRKALRDEMQNYNSDESTIKNTTAELKALQAQMLDQKVDGFLAMREILTPEQFQKMNDLREERRNQNREKMQGHKKGRGKRS